PVEGGERRLPAAGQPQEVRPAVGRRGPPVDEAALAQAAQDAAQVAGVQPQLLAELGGAGPLAVGQLVEDARLRERERALQQAFLQHADPPGIEPVEAPRGLHAPLQAPSGHGRLRPRGQVGATVNYLADEVKYRDRSRQRAAGLERRHEVLELPRPVVPPLADEERRRPVDPAAHAAQEVAPYARLELAGGQRVAESLRVETELLRERD